MSYRTIVCASPQCQRPFHGTTDQAIEMGWAFNMHPNRPILCRQCSSAERDVMADNQAEWIAQDQPSRKN